MTLRTAALTLLLAACGSSKPAPVPPPETPPEPSQPPAQPPAPPPVVDATPDTPSADAAKRDAELAQKAAGFIDAFSNSFPTLTRDGKRVVFTSTRDGLPQLYIGDVAKPTAAPVRLMEAKERSVSPVLLKDGKSLLFRSDVGANELWSIFRIGLDGKDLVELTPGEPLQRDDLFVRDGAPDTVFFSGRAHTSPSSSVYSISASKPGPAKKIYTDEVPAFLTDVSPDAKTALLLQLPSQSETYLMRLDLASGKGERLYPTEGKVTVEAAVFSADGKLAYVATDEGKEQVVLHALDVKTGKSTAKYTVTPSYAMIGDISVAKKGGLLALTIIAGNHVELRLLDAKKLTEKAQVKLPLGQGGAGDFSEDGKRLVATWSTPSTPGEIFAIDATTGKVEPLRKEERPSLKDMPSIEVSSTDLPAFDGGKIPTNVYVPKGEVAKPHPVLVVYHGGPAGVSQIRWSPGTAYFLSLGYVVVEPNVRGSSGYGRAFEEGDNGAKRLDAFKDIETSARWVGQQPWADKSRLVVYGGSYGGYTTLVALSRWPDIWRAGVNLFGVVNLKTFMSTTSGLIRKLFLVEFGDPDKDAAFLAQISPITDVAKIVDPTFVYAGANDPRVPRTESDLIVKALRQHKVPSEYMVADNEGHSLARRETQLQFYSRAARFLETHLK